MTEITHRLHRNQRHPDAYWPRKAPGQLVLLCHGFPESWYSWRHQIDALAAAGFHAVAPDMRGYGQTDHPEAIDQYTLLHLVGDMVGVLDALGTDTAVIAGHDWGAPVAWHAALMRPDRFRAVIGLSVPYRPRGKARPTTVMPQTEDAVFYQLHFQTPGVAEAELAFNTRATISGILYSLSGDGPPGSANFSMVPRDPASAPAAGHRPPDLAGMAHRGRHRLLHRRVYPRRLPRRTELVPQHRPQLGTSGALRRRARHRPGTLHRRRT